MGGMYAPVYDSRDTREAGQREPEGRWIPTPRRLRRRREPPRMGLDGLGWARQEKRHGREPALEAPAIAFVCLRQGREFEHSGHFARQRRTRSDARFPPLDHFAEDGPEEVSGHLDPPPNAEPNRACAGACLAL